MIDVVFSLVLALPSFLVLLWVAGMEYQPFWVFVCIGGATAISVFVCVMDVHKTKVAYASWLATSERDQ